jgi:serine protease
LWADISPGGVAVVGIRAPGSERGVEHGRVVVNRAERQLAEAAIARIPGISILDRDERLPIVRVKIEDVAALQRLRRLPQVDYVEPDIDKSVPPGQLFQSACGGGGFGGGTITVPPLGDVIGTRVEQHAITSAWAYSTGSGVTIGLVDTGVDPVQPQLHDGAFGQFVDGMSGGRSVAHTYTRGSNYYDNCGHGTHMAGIMAAPRDGRNVVGIAWGANLYTVKVQDDPFLDPFSVTDTRLGIGYAASVTKLVVMGFGTTNGYSSIEDEIAYWYNFGRLFIAPSGQFPNTCPPFECRTGVMFPARLNTVTAATSSNCEECLWGPEVDYHGHSGNPTTGAINIGHPDIGSSSQTSGAAAIIGGIAALVWSRYPTWTRSDVLNKLNICGGIQGAPSAYCAVTDPPPLTIQGPENLQGNGDYPGPYYAVGVYTAMASGGYPSSLSHEWTVDDAPVCGTGPTCEITFPVAINYDWGGTFYTRYVVRVVGTAPDGQRYMAWMHTDVNCMYPDGSRCPP